MPNNEMDYSLIHRTPDGNGKILVTTPGSPDKGSWETEAELKTYVNQRVVKHTADLPGTTTPINAAQLNGVPDSGFVKKYSQSPADWDTVPTNGSNKPVTSDGVYDAINAISNEKIKFAKYKIPKSTKYKFYNSSVYTCLLTAEYRLGKGKFVSIICGYDVASSRNYYSTLIDKTEGEIIITLDSDCSFAIENTSASVDYDLSLVALGYGQNIPTKMSS